MYQIVTGYYPVYTTPSVPNCVRLLYTTPFTKMLQLFHIRFWKSSLNTDSPKCGSGSARLLTVCRNESKKLRFTIRLLKLKPELNRIPVYDNNLINQQKTIFVVILKKNTFKIQLIQYSL